MGYVHKAQPNNNNNNNNNNNSSDEEALLFATMCIIGIPVDVQVKDGSLYSGIFHTASLDNQYGIVLKKARLTKKGKTNANVVNGREIETLVILSHDLVQLVAKGVSLATDVVTGNIAIANGEADVPCEHLGGNTKKLTKLNMSKKKINQKSRENDNGNSHSYTSEKVGKENDGRKFPIDVEKRTKDVSSDNTLRREHDNLKQNSGSLLEERADVEQGSSSRLEAMPHPNNSTQEGQQRVDIKLSNGVSHDPSPAIVQPDYQYVERPNSAGTSSPTVDNIYSSRPNTLLAPPAPAGMILPQSSSESNKSSKEFKLNPGAKIFSPSFANHPTSATAPVMPTVTNLTYMPSNSPTVVVANGGQPEVGISPAVSRSSAPPKFFQYGNLSAANGDSGSQFSHHNVGHMVNRTHPVKYAAQYHHPVQAGPTYMNPNSQAVMIGRLGQQLVYLQPVSHDMVQGPPAISTVPARPMMAPPIQFPKHQGTPAGPPVPMCMPRPFMANGQQPFIVPNHIPVLQPPFPTNHHIPVPGSNGLYGNKFP